MRVVLIAADLDHADHGNTTTVRRWLRHARDVDLRLAPPDPGLRLEPVPDLVHAYHALHAGPAAIELARRYRRPLVVSLGGTDLFADQPAPALVEADVVTGAFPSFERFLRERTGSGARYVTVRRGVEIDAVAAPRLPDGRLRVVLAAGLREVKDPLLAVEMAHGLVERGLPLSLRIVGPDRSPAYAAAVRARAAPLPYVSFGVVAHEAMGDLYRSCDVVWNTSQSEGGCNVLLEAIAHGCAVLGRDVPGNHDMLPEPLRFTPGDWSFLDAFHRGVLAETPAARAARVEAGLRRLRQHHDPEDEARDLAAAWRHAIGRADG